MVLGLGFWDLGLNSQTIQARHVVVGQGFGSMGSEREKQVMRISGFKTPGVHIYDRCGMGSEKSRP